MYFYNADQIMAVRDYYHRPIGSRDPWRGGLELQKPESLWESEEQFPYSNNYKKSEPRCARVDHIAEEKNRP